MREEYVYFIRPIGMLGPVKIGCSYLPTARLQMMSRWSPYPLEIVATIPGGPLLERNIHECLADAYSHREWFLPTPAVLALVDGLIAGKSVGECIDLSARKWRVGKFAGREPRSKTAAKVREFMAKARPSEGAAA